MGESDQEITLLINPPVGSVYNYPEVPPLTLNIPDTGFPPEPYLEEPYPPIHLDKYPEPQDDQNNRNYVATGSKPNSEPSMHNEEGWSENKDPPRDNQNVGVVAEIANKVLHTIGKSITEATEKTIGTDIEKNRTDYLHPDGELPHQIIVTEEDDDKEEKETLFSDKIDQQRDNYLHPNGEGEPAQNVRIVKDETQTDQVAPEIHIHLNLDKNEDTFEFKETMDE